MTLYVNTVVYIQQKKSYKFNKIQRYWWPCKNYNVYGNKENKIEIVEAQAMLSVGFFLETKINW